MNKVVNTESSNNTFIVPLCYLSKVVKKCKTIMNKCAKENVPYTFELLGEPYKAHVRHNKAKYEIDVQKMHVDVHFEFNGWKVMGTMLDVEGIRQIFIAKSESANEATLTKELDNTGFVCQHCNKSVRRKSVVLLENIETHEHKVVGTSCLKLFTGGLDGNLVLTYHDIYEYLRECDLAGCRIDSDSCYEEYDLIDDHLISSGTTTPIYDLIDLLKVVAYLVRTEGFKKTDSVDSTAKSLRDSVQGFLSVYPTEEDESLAKAVMAWGKTVEVSGSYLYNVKQLCSCEASTSFSFGIVASMISAYQRELVKSQTKQESKSCHVGNIGERITFNATLTKISSYSTYTYNSYTEITMYLVLFEDANGNVFKWNTSAFHAHEMLTKPVTLTGTVKGHSEWHGIKQTELNRCKIQAV